MTTIELMCDYCGERDSTDLLAKDDNFVDVTKTLKSSLKKFGWYCEENIILGENTFFCCKNCMTRYNEEQQNNLTGAN